MVITALGVTLLFVALGLATALLAAVHDAIAALVQRRQARAAAVVYPVQSPAPGAGAGAGRIARRSRPPVGQVPAPAKVTYVVEPTPAPAWLNIARNNMAYTNTTKARRFGK